MQEVKNSGCWTFDLWYYLFQLIPGLQVQYQYQHICTHTQNKCNYQGKQDISREKRALRHTPKIINLSTLWKSTTFPSLSKAACHFSGFSILVAWNKEPSLLMPKKRAKNTTVTPKSENGKSIKDHIYTNQFANKCSTLFSYYIEIIKTEKLER